MKNDILLCGHTGSCNRGCEAILRSTKYILSQVSTSHVAAMTFDEKYDKELGLDKELELIPYPQKTVIQKGLSYAKRKVMHDSVWGNRVYHKKMIAELDKDAIVFNVGGDTYCYGDAWISYALNDLTTEYGIKSVFWGCSVDESALEKARMQEDLNKYDAIVVRESLSEQILKKVVHDQSKILRACDPAFQLPICETDLPNGFISGNTVGINVSPLVFADYHNKDDLMRQNIAELIKWIVNETDMAICLIPHVYNIEKSIQDIDVLKEIYNEFKDTGRVCIVDKELSCVELKYIISKCRFFVGARTHSTIAAYSTQVPTLAISYSIKSRGIAKDLFGTEEGFAIPWKKLKSQFEIRDNFKELLVSHEQELREHYAKIMPEYKNSILKVAHTVVNK